ncbi:MAG: zinc-dependent dehydrogenase [Candidatus Thermoplasmatota archaeon]|nr:zinc-dependent dehydrogenase [Candidatus Thermoplasmatota archaeon]
MKVAMYYNNNDVRIEEMPVPEIRPGELLVKVKACGICGSDVMEWYRIKTAPRVLGHEMTGDIVKVGEEVRNYKKGDHVFVSHHVPCNECSYCLNDQHTLCDTLHSTNFYPGGFSEYIRVPEINVEKGTFKLPDEISYEEGTLIEPLACVVRGLRIARFKKGQTVLIIGSGMAGLLHVKLARAMGAKFIITTDINDYRLDKAREFGADLALHADDNILQEIKKINDGHMPDLVVTCTGAPPAVNQAIQTVGRGGTILFFAPTGPGLKISFPLLDLWNKGVTMVSTYAGAPKDIVESIELLRSGKVKVKDMITHLLPLEKIQKGFQIVARAENSIKVVIKP